MKLTVSTPIGVVYDSDVNHIVCKSQDGEFAIFKDHIAIVSIIGEGYVKAVNNGEEFIAIESGVLEYNNNVCTVLAQEGFTGKTYEEAKRRKSNYNDTRDQENKKKMTDLALAESELKKQIKKTGAGKV